MEKGYVYENFVQVYRTIDLNNRTTENDKLPELDSIVVAPVIESKNYFNATVHIIGMI